jgi:hypothetical protein
MLKVFMLKSSFHLQVIPPVMTLIQDLRVKQEQLLTSGSSTPLPSFSYVDVALDRLFQLIQMLITSECLDRNEIRKYLIMKININLSLLGYLFKT